VDEEFEKGEGGENAVKDGGNEVKPAQSEIGQSGPPAGEGKGGKLELRSESRGGSKKGPRGRLRKDEQAGAAPSVVGARGAGLGGGGKQDRKKRTENLSRVVARSRRFGS